jgi:hypothetical protein
LGIEELAMNNPNIKSVIKAAADACKSLSQCTNFFNSDETESWRGWENWLTVDIVRRLNSASVVRFGHYPSKSEKTDILVPKKIAVEIKTNYVETSEVEAWIAKASYRLPDRVIRDLRKLNRLGKDMKRVLLFAIAFENPKDQAKYKRLLDQYLTSSWDAWEKQWHKCKTLMLLALTS